MTEVEQSPLIKRQIVWRNYCEQMTEKQNSVGKFAPNPQKKKQLLYLEFFVASSKKEMLSIKSRYESVKIT